MKYLTKTWVRILISLIIAGVATELLHVSTGNPNRPQQGNIYLLPMAVVFYFILTAAVKRRSSGL